MINNSTPPSNSPAKTAATQVMDNLENNEFCNNVPGNTTPGNNDPSNITPARLARIRHVLEHRQPDLTLVLANIHDPHNVSAIYRSCDAFGVDTVHLYYTNTEFPQLARKSSASARKWVNTVRHKNREALFSALKSQNCQVLATSCTAEAKSIENWDFTRPTAIIMGNEHAGVDAELSELVDGELYIPMYGMIQSFNVSVAAAIILAEACRQRKDAGFYNQPSFSPAELEERVKAWIAKK